MPDNANRGLMIAGAMLVAEGAAFAVMGRQYVDFMERKGLMDAGKRLVRRLDVRSPTVFTALGLAELVWGVVLLRRAYTAGAGAAAAAW
jgi:hypothetical protein